MHKQLLSKVTHIALLKVHPHTLLQRKFSIGLTGSFVLYPQTHEVF